jgi:hypothetical protein
MVIGIAVASKAPSGNAGAEGVVDGEWVKQSG